MCLHISHICVSSQATAKAFYVIYLRNKDGSYLHATVLCILLQVRELTCLDIIHDIQHWDSLFHLISIRRFNMFTSSLSAWETPMEESQGGNGVLSLQVTTAAWFNGTVCKKAEQQSVNQTAEVAQTDTHTLTQCQKTQWRWTVKNFSISDSVSLSPCPQYKHTHTHTHTNKMHIQTHAIKKLIHVCPKRLWQELRQVEMNTVALRAHSKKSAVRKTRSPLFFHQARRWMPGTLVTSQVLSQRFAGDPTKHAVISTELAAMKVNPNKCNEWFTKYLAD